MNEEPKLIESSLSQTVEREEHSLRIDIYRSESEPDWILEVVNETGTSFVWDDRFATDQAALDAANTAFQDGGVDAFLG